MTSSGSRPPQALPWASDPSQLLISRKCLDLDPHRDFSKYKRKKFNISFLLKHHFVLRILRLHKVSSAGTKGSP